MTYPTKQQKIKAIFDLSEPYTKVILRFQGGILSQQIKIPTSCLKSEYKLPLNRKMGYMLIGEVQDLLNPETTQNKCLIFKWDGNSTWGIKIPILDLIDYYPLMTY